MDWKKRFFFDEVDPYPVDEAGGTFNNSLFNNSFDFVLQLKNKSFLGTISVHKKLKLELIEHNYGHNYV
jgi:hypothetical protein